MEGWKNPFFYRGKNIHILDGGGASREEEAGKGKGKGKGKGRAAGGQLGFNGILVRRA